MVTRFGRSPEHLGRPATTPSVQRRDPISTGTQTEKADSEVHERQERHDWQHRIRVLEAENQKLRLGQRVFQELWLFSRNSPSQLSLVYTEELERATNMHRSLWTRNSFGFASIVRFPHNPGARCRADQCQHRAVTACSNCDRPTCISHMPCDDCAIPMRRYVRVLLTGSAFPTGTEVTRRGGEGLQWPCFLNRPRPSLENLPRFRFYCFAELDDSDLHRRIQEWKTNIDALPTGIDAPPLARAFNYVKGAPGVWLADVSDVLYPFQVIRTTLNHSFPICGYNGTIWSSNVSFLLTCADHDEVRRHAFNIVVLVRGWSTRSVSVAYLIPHLVALLMPRPCEFKDRDAARLDKETKRYASRNAQQMRHPQYKWLTRYYRYFPNALTMPRTADRVSFSLFEPVIGTEESGPRLQRLIRKIRFYATTNSLPCLGDYAPPGHGRRQGAPRRRGNSGNQRRVTGQRRRH